MDADASRWIWNADLLDEATSFLTPGWATLTDLHCRSKALFMSATQQITAESPG